MAHPVSYDQARFWAWKILWQTEKKETFADLILEEVLAKQKNLTLRDRAFIYELVLGTLRWQGKIDRHISLATRFPRKKIKAKLHTLLRLGAYQLLFLNKVPDAAAVNESVRLAKAFFREERIVHFVNAVLRTVARHKDQQIAPALNDDPVEHIATNFSHPRWLVELWIKEYGIERTLEICAANNLHPPLTLRANTLQTNREELKAVLTAAGLEVQPTPFSPWGLIINKPFLANFEAHLHRGDFYIQDEASQIIPMLLEVQPGHKVLDVCAAPGGKSTHLAQLMHNQGEIIGLDLSIRKIKLIQENCRRLGVQIVKTICADSSRALPLKSQLTFDRILIDAPCSGLGILHRHPDIKWRRRPEDIERLSHLQLSLLENVSSYLKSGGLLVYSTCTMTGQENELVIEKFLRRHQDFVQEDLSYVIPPALQLLINSQGFLRTYPDFILPHGEYRMDGFFAARLRRNGKEKH